MNKLFFYQTKVQEVFKDFFDRERYDYSNLSDDELYIISLIYSIGEQNSMEDNFNRIFELFEELIDYTQKKLTKETDLNLCVCCGAVIPEGNLICKNCECAGANGG